MEAEFLKVCGDKEPAQVMMQFEQIDFEQVAEATSQERHESCEAEWCIQEHTAQREVVAVEEQQKLRKKSLEIQVEEK